MSLPDDSETVTFASVLRRLRYWEQNANAGRDRKVFQAWFSELYEDGSGKLSVEMISTQADTEEEKLFSTLFPTTRTIEFENVNEMLDTLENMSAIPLPEHPEL